MMTIYSIRGVPWRQVTANVPVARKFLSALSCPDRKALSFEHIAQLSFSKNVLSLSPHQRMKFCSSVLYRAFSAGSRPGDALCVLFTLNPPVSFVCQLKMRSGQEDIKSNTNERGREKQTYRPCVHDIRTLHTHYRKKEFDERYHH